jgi:hypothetical protein
MAAAPKGAAKRVESLADVSRGEWRCQFELDSNSISPLLLRYDELE